MELDPIIMVYGIHGEYERKFLQCQQFWRQKWNELESINRDLNRTTSAKFKIELDRFEQSYKLLHQFEQEQPCKNIESDLIKCYESCHNQTLRCSEHVRKFAQCIDLYRIKLLKQ